MLVPEELHAGDLLMYSPTDWIGWLIAIKTWTLLSHVECYCGNGRVVAARPAGVDLYDERIDESLRYVRRPVIGPGKQFDIQGAMVAMKSFLGKPYQISGLFRFYLPWHHRHKATRICSSVATVFLRAGGCEPFNPSIKADDVAPSMLLQTNDLCTVWERNRMDC